MTDQVFTPKEVAALMKSQLNFQRHPFTCANRGDGNHERVFNDLGVLIPTVRGWICPFCDYTQDWAHGFMKVEDTSGQSKEISSAPSTPPSEGSA